MIDPELKSLVESEIADFYAGLFQPGEPEMVEQSQREITRRVLMAIEHWCASRINRGGKPFVVKLPETFYGVVQLDKVVMLTAKDGHWLNLTAVKEAIRAAGGEIAE